VPFGYRYNKEKETFEENPETLEAVRLIFYIFASEDLSLQKLAGRLNQMQIPTPRGGDRWRASTLGNILRNEVYAGKLYQFKNYHVEPKSRRRPLTKNKKTATNAIQRLCRIS